MSAMSFATSLSGLTCPGCGKTTLLAREILAIKEAGLCFDCQANQDQSNRQANQDQANRNQSNQWPAPTTPEPSLEQMMEWEAEGGCEATDGCYVEPDCESCPHGYPSWLVYLGYI